jgi:hypothetical protein
MLIPPGPIRVLMAVKPVDFRNYAERMIMLSRRVSRSRLSGLINRLLEAGRFSTQHN